MVQGENRPPSVQWYRPAEDPDGVHFGYAGPRWVPLIPLVLQMPLFLVLFRAFSNGEFALLGWTAAVTVAAGSAVWLFARRVGVGYYVVDDFGRPIRRASRRLDGVPRVVRNRPVLGKDDFLQRTSSAGR